MTNFCYIIHYKYWYMIFRKIHLISYKLYYTFDITYNFHIDTYFISRNNVDIMSTFSTRGISSCITVIIIWKFLQKALESMTTKFSTCTLTEDTCQLIWKAIKCTNCHWYKRLRASFLFCILKDRSFFIIFKLFIV